MMNITLKNFLPLFSSWNGKVVVEQLNDKGEYIPVNQGYPITPEKDLLNVKVLAFDTQGNSLHVLIEGKRQETCYLNLQKQVEIGSYVYGVGSRIHTIQKFKVTDQNYELISRFIGKDFFFSEEVAKRETNRRLAKCKESVTNIRY